MPFLTRLRTGEKLALVFGTVILLMLTMAGLSFIELNKAEARNHELVVEQAERVSLAREWRENILVNSQRSIAVGLSTEPLVTSYFEPLLSKTTARTTEIQKRYTELETSTEGQATQQRMADRRKAYLEQRKRLLEARNDREKLAVEADAFKAVTEEYIQAATDLVDFQMRRQKDTVDSVTSGMGRMRWTLITATALSVLAACALGWVVARSITHPLARIERSAERIAQGDLSERLDSQPGRDETARLSTAMCHMRGALRSLVSQVQTASESIDVASREVASGNADLSSRTEHTAAGLQQTASTMQQLTQTVRQSADSAQTANALAQSAGDVARRGGEMVSGVVRTMDEIQQASRKVNDIIGVIDGIAFQTNILALNAAVEAARAGEQGRGFAVVAGEVRNLAQRSADAAREVKALIGTSVDRVESGSRLVNEAGQTMQAIVTSVQQVTDIVNEISHASVEQSQGIDGVNSVVAQIEQSTQQNAALVEESAAAAASLRDQAQKLSEVVGGFRL